MITIPDRFSDLTGKSPIWVERSQPFWARCLGDDRQPLHSFNQWELHRWEAVGNAGDLNLRIPQLWKWMEMDSAETKMLWRVASWWRSTTWLSTNCFAQKERNSDAYNLNHHENHNFGILVTISLYNHFLQTWFHTPQSCENLCASPGTFAVTRHAWFVRGIQVSFKITVPRVRWASALFFLANKTIAFWTCWYNDHHVSS